jgi:Xaa-Pro aminopeptidase
MTTRLDRVRELLTAQSLDAILVTNATNRRYLSGYTADDHATDESSGVVLIDANAATLYTSPINAGWAEAEASEGITVAHWGRPWTDTIVEAAKSQGWKRLGFEEAVTTVADYFRMHEGLAETTELVPIGDAIDKLRAIKDETEIALLEQALHLTDLAFTAAAARMAEGQTEFALAEIVREELKRVGSEGEAFPTIVASGPNAANPHHNPSDRRIQPGEPVIIDMGARHRGYNGDLTRTIWIGEPEPKLIEVYQLVQQAQVAALAGIKAGETGKQADAYCRDIFARAGMAEYYIHSTGHGLGLRVHEAPSASMHADAILQPGEVVTVEPGLYIPGWGGVRIEDVVLITADGNRNLTGAPKN